MNPRFVAVIVALRLRRILADRANIIWLLVMPLIFAFLMGMLMGDWSAARPRPLVVVAAPDSSASLATLMAPLLASGAFRVTRIDSVFTADDARALVDDTWASAVLLVNPGFGDSLAAGLAPHLRFYQDGGRTSAQRARQALATAVSRLEAEVSARTLVAADPAQVARGEAMAFDDSVFSDALAHPRLRLAVSSLGRSRYEDLALTDARQHSGPAYTLMFTLMFLLMSAKDLVAERKQRTLDRLRLSHISAADLTVGYFLGGFLIGVLQMGVLLTLNSLLFGIDYGNSPITLALMAVLFTATAAAMGLLLGSLARTPAQADALGMVLGMSLPALGGLWWPLEITPKFMQSLGHALPTGQAITILHGLIGRGTGLAEAVPYLAGLLAWTLAILVAAVLAFQRRAAT